MKRLHAIIDCYKNCSTLEQMFAYEDLMGFIMDPNKTPILKFNKLKRFAYLDLTDRMKIIYLMMALRNPIELLLAVAMMDELETYNYASLRHTVINIPFDPLPEVMTTTENGPPRKLKRKRNRPFCNFCHKYSHVEQECWKRNQRRTPSRRANHPEEQSIEGPQMEIRIILVEIPLHPPFIASSGPSRAA